MTTKITIKEIAEMSQTSKTTVSFYLNGHTDKMSDATKKRIEKVIKETGYEPSFAARSLNKKSTKLIGVLIGDITNSFSNQIVKGIEDITSEKGYQIIVGNSNYDHKKEEDYINNMLLMGVDGFIVQPTAQFRKISKKVESLGKPLVFFDSKLYNHTSKWVKTNNYDATYDTTQICVHKGYTKYIMITADPSLISTRIERTTGFMDALNDNDLECTKLIVDEDGMEAEDLKKFLEENISKTEKTLIFIPNCWALPTVYVALKEFRSHMPHIGLIGFDNTEWTNFSVPTVTTIVQPAFEEGQQTAKILIDQIEGLNEEAPQQTLDCKINWNESTL